MASNAKPVPEGYHTLTPHLVTPNASQAIDFYQRAFDAEKLAVHWTPDGKVMHATLKIGDSILMLSDDFADGKAAKADGPRPSEVVLHIYVDNVDTLFNRAVAAGATVTMPLMNAFWGDRYGQLKDPFGNRWSLATHLQDLTSEQVQEGGKAFFAKSAVG
jgi:PhnB protein